jgi:hypothetical protein
MVKRGVELLCVPKLNELNIRFILYAVMPSLVDDYMIVTRSLSLELGQSVHESVILHAYTNISQVQSCTAFQRRIKRLKCLGIVNIISEAGGRKPTHECCLTLSQSIRMAGKTIS